MGRLVASRWSQTFETRASKDAATERSFRSETSTSRAAAAAAKPLGDALICSSAGHIQTVVEFKTGRSRRLGRPFCAKANVRRLIGAVPQ
jgi:hypothetical protein